MDESSQLGKIYNILYSSFGKQKWWPGDTRDEIIIGAILTQNASWVNVEKAIGNLKKNNCLSLKCIYESDTDYLSQLIKPAGFYNQKTRTLKTVADYFLNNFNHRKIMVHKAFRRELLSLKGIGKETADSILLYAFNIPVFVVDAYTKRVLLRHGIIEENADYDSIQSLFQENLPRDTYVYNEFHALFVKLGKEFCLRRSPKCNECPIKKGGF